MKQTIKLTESDLVRLVNKVITEQKEESKMNRKLDRFISSQFEPFEDESEVTDRVGGRSSIKWYKNGIEIVEIEDLERFYIANHIWDAIRKIFNLDHNETQSIIQDWVAKHYGLEGVLPIPRRDRFGINSFHS